MLLERSKRKLPGFARYRLCRNGVGDLLVKLLNNPSLMHNYYLYARLAATWQRIYRLFAARMIDDDKKVKFGSHVIHQCRMYALLAGMHGGSRRKRLISVRWCIIFKKLITDFHYAVTPVFFGCNNFLLAYQAYSIFLKLFLWRRDFASSVIYYRNCIRC